MTSYAEKRFLPYTPAQVFALVAAVDRYPEFLPWCLKARIRSTEKLENPPQGTLILADLIIGFQRIRQRYTSRVTLQPPQRIDVIAVKGPFRYLNSHWAFEPVSRSVERSAAGTMVSFRIEFEFRSALLQLLMDGLLKDAARRMLVAFKRRASELYSTRPSAVLLSGCAVPMSQAPAEGGAA